MGEHSSVRGQQLRTMALMELPDSLLLETFFYLQAPNLASVAQCCSRLHCITRDELLWKRVFRQRFKVPPAVAVRPGAVSWRAEYQRLREETPSVLCEELTRHRDQVLHVAFSHNGQMFATCSKDAKILVWNSESPSTLRFSANMTEQFNWRYSQFSQFNSSDTLLLVSGVFHGNMTTSGEIAVFDLKEFQVQCRVTNKPYDVFGCWYDNQHLFSGSLYWTGHLQSISALWLNKASQEVESEKESVMMNLYRFSNVNASSIRTVMVAHVPVVDTNTPSSEHPQTSQLPSAQVTVMDTNTPSSEHPQTSQLPSAHVPVVDTNTPSSEHPQTSQLRSAQVTVMDTNSPSSEHPQTSQLRSAQVTVMDTNTPSSEHLQTLQFRSAQVTVMHTNTPSSEHSQTSECPSAEVNIMETDEEEEEQEDTFHTASETRDASNQDASRNSSCADISLARFGAGDSEGERGGGGENRAAASPQGDRLARNDVCDWLNEDEVLYEARGDRTGQSTAAAAAASWMMEGVRDADWPRGPPAVAGGGGGGGGGGLGRDSSGGVVAGESLTTNSGVPATCAQRPRRERCRRDGVKNHRRDSDGLQSGDPPSSSSSSSSSSPLKACHPFSYCCSENGSGSGGGSRCSALDGHQAESVMEALHGALGFPFQDSPDSSYSFSPSAQSLGWSTSDADTPTPTPLLPLPPHPHPHPHPAAAAAAGSPPHRHSSDIPRLSSLVPPPPPPDGARSWRTEKVLIFSMGEETYTPHLIGFKRVLLKDIVGEEEAERRRARAREKGLEDEEGGEEVLLPNVEHNLQGMSQPPTQVDHAINLRGHIVGMALSPDHRYLYVNSRQWPHNYHIESALEPPPIAQEIDIHVIDLATFTEVGKVMTSHKAFTPNDECFFLFLDVSQLYVASGAEDKRGYLWDRHYGVHLHCFPHSDVVNSVAFNPRDPEMLVSVSDDNTVRVWRSRRQMRGGLMKGGVAGTQHHQGVAVAVAAATDEGGADEGRGGRDTAVIC